MVKLSDLNAFGSAVAGHIIAVVVVVFCFVFLFNGKYESQAFGLISFVLGVYIPSPTDVARILKLQSKKKGGSGRVEGLDTV